MGMSIRLSDRMFRLRNYWMDFNEIWYWGSTMGTQEI